MSWPSLWFYGIRLDLGDFTKVGGGSMWKVMGDLSSSGCNPTTYGGKRCKLSSGVRAELPRKRGSEHSNLEI